jgi:spore maturation protein CgeB
MSSLLNRTKIKQLALEAAKTRHHQFTRVSSEFVDHIESVVRSAVVKRVAQAPSKGKTL